MKYLKHAFASAFIFASGSALAFSDTIQIYTSGATESAATHSAYSQGHAACVLNGYAHSSVEIVHIWFGDDSFPYHVYAVATCYN